MRSNRHLPLALVIAAAAICLAPRAWALPKPSSASKPAASQPAPSPADPAASPGVSAQAQSPAESEPPLPRPFPPLGAAGHSSPGIPGDVGLPFPDRWRIGQPPDYVQNRQGDLINPYRQNILKGDYPILGQDKFLVLTLTSDTLFEARRVPIPSGVSTADAGRFRFFGEGDVQLISQNLVFSVELFQGDAGYKPRDWTLKFTPVANLNYVHADELNVIDPNVELGRDRTDEWIGIQEAFAELKLADLSSHYDFLSLRAGIQGFNSDFRGFLFADNQPGLRLFGNYDNNQTQFNLAAFATLEKDTNSGLNSFTLRDQTVLVANLYRQDFVVRGYTAQLSLQANLDESGGRLDTNGFVVRPAPVGDYAEKDVRAYYLGWAGDGHLGRLNLTHQFYQAFGVESHNPISQDHLDINAQFFAAELSYDVDWQRYRASFAYASGDDDPLDGNGRGFDTIFDNPNFAGGGFSYFTRQAIRLTGTGLNLVNRNSFVPDLRTSKEQGQANFVNPGLLLYNLGADFDITPRVKVICNASYLQFATAEPLRLLLHDNGIGRDIGIDYSVGVQYRPLLNNNILFTVGAGALTPAEGFKQIYTAETLYSVFAAFTFTF